MVGEEVRCIQLSINYGRQTDLLNILCSAGKNISVNALLVSIYYFLVSTFLFHNFYFLNQLTHIIFVISDSQQTKISEVTDGTIKILLKIDCGTHHPIHIKL